MKPLHMSTAAIVVVALLVCLDKTAWCKGADFCFDQNTVCRKGKGTLECKKKELIYVTSANVYHNQSPCDDKSTCQSDIKNSEESFDGIYELDLLRRCSAQNSCDMSEVGSTTNTSVKIEYSCTEALLLDPCKAGSTLFGSDFTIHLSDNFDQFQNCTCRVQPYNNTDITAQILDIRLNETARDRCQNRVTFLDDSGEELAQYNCTNTPQYHTTIAPRSQTSYIDISVELGQDLHPEFIWIFIDKEGTIGIVNVTCTSVLYPLTTLEVVDEVTSVAPDNATINVLKTGDCPTGEDGDNLYKTTTVAMAAVSGALAVIVLIIVVVFFNYRRRRLAEDHSNDDRKTSDDAIKTTVTVDGGVRRSGQTGVSRVTSGDGTHVLEDTYSSVYHPATSSTYHVTSNESGGSRSTEGKVTDMNPSENYVYTKISKPTKTRGNEDNNITTKIRSPPPPPPPVKHVNSKNDPDHAYNTTRDGISMNPMTASVSDDLYQNDAVVKAEQTANRSEPYTDSQEDDYDHTQSCDRIYGKEI